MERVQPITVPRRTVVALAAGLLLAGAGCHGADTAQESYTAMKRTLRLGPAEPVTEVIIFCQRRLNTLPDPTRDGQLVPGLVGQVFLIAPRSRDAEVNGDLGIVMYDTTERAAGQPEKTPEMFHIDPTTLARMRTKDERLGPCYAVFLPWPAAWTDVTSVKVMATYQAEGRPALQSREVLLNMETGEVGQPVWRDKSYTMTGGAMLPDKSRSGGDLRGVPDPLKMLAALRSGKSQAAPPAQPTAPAPETFVRSNVPSVDSTRPGAGVTGVTPGVIPPGLIPTQKPPASAPQVGGGLSNVYSPTNSVNTPFATEGAYAGPRPGPAPVYIDPAGANGPVQPILIRRDQQ